MLAATVAALWAVWVVHQQAARVASRLAAMAVKWVARADSLPVVKAVHLPVVKAGHPRVVKAAHPSAVKVAVKPMPTAMAPVMSTTPVAKRINYRWPAVSLPHSVSRAPYPRYAKAVTLAVASLGHCAVKTSHALTLMVMGCATPMTRIATLMAYFWHAAGCPQTAPRAPWPS